MFVFTPDKRIQGKESCDFNIHNQIIRSLWFISCEVIYRGQKRDTWFLKVTTRFYKE